MSQAMTAPAGTMRPPVDLRRSIANTLKGSAGNLVEWYDVYVYSVFLVYFESQFFDPQDESSTLYGWAIFAITFLMRPIGSLFFGWFADTHGRRRSLVVSVTLMAACSLVVALTPTREAIGGWAAVILIVCRLVQGFATGGEYGTSATYMSEAAVPHRRGLLSSFQYVTLVGGHVLAQLTLLLMVLFASPEWISTTGWRIAFAIGGLAAVVVFLLRRSMDESLTEQALVQARSGQGPRHGSIGELLSQYWRELLVCFALTLGGTVAFYTYSVTGPSIVKSALAGSDLVVGTVVNLATLTLLMVLQPLGGWLSDVVGRRTLLVGFGIGGVLYTWVLTLVLPRQTDGLAAFALLAGGFVILTGYTSINAAAKASLFPAHVRALGVGLGYALANSLVGGTAPLLHAAAKKGGGLPEFTAYVTGVIALSLLVYVVLLRNAGTGPGRLPTWLDDEAAAQARHERRPWTFGV